MSKRFRRIILWLMLLSLAVLAGGAVGPDYKRPVIDSPGRFRDDNAPTNRSFADLNWWIVYRDDMLQALVGEAFTNNYDLRIALAQVEQARQVAAQATPQFVPNGEYNGAVSQGRNDLFEPVFPNDGTTVGSASTAVNAFWDRTCGAVCAGSTNPCPPRCLRRLSTLIQPRGIPSSRPGY
jgi:outer membrane protein TolC